MPCPLPHHHYCCSLPSPVCLPHLLICTYFISSPIACPPSSVLCWCFFFFVFFLNFVVCYISLWFICFFCFFFWAYVKCWVRVASSTWNVLWLWNTNKGRLQKQVQKTTWKFSANVIEQHRQRRSITILMLKVASPNGLNSRRVKLEQSSD